MKFFTRLHTSFPPLVIALICVTSVSDAGKIRQSKDVVTSLIYVPDLRTISQSSLIGGLLKGKWVGDQVLNHMIQARRSFKVYSLSGLLGTGNAGGWQLLGQTGNEFYGANFVSSARVEGSGFGVTTAWDAMPRIPKAVRDQHKEYSNLVDALLRKKGFKKPIVRINQILKIDLDGDKEEETLIGAGFGNSQDSTLSTFYSCVLLCTKTNQGWNTLLLNGSFFPNQNSRLTRQFNAHDFKVGAVLDLFGDKAMEIILSYSGYEESGFSVYRYRHQRLEHIGGQ